MAVMDFREGGYVFSRHKVRREFAYDSGEWEEAEPGYQGDPRYAADPAAGDGIATRIARLTHYLGALASVGLMVGLLAWGWQLVSRDVSGVPVIRAIEGEARSAPDNPGGELANYSGLTVNEVAAGAASAPVQELALAPSASELTGDDVAMGALGVEAREPSNRSDVPLTFDGEPITPLSDREALAMAEAAAAAAAQLAAADDAVSQATISDAPALEGPVTNVLTDENGAPADDAIAAALAEAQAVANPASLRASSRPAPRPRETRVASAPATTRTDAAPQAAAPVPAPAARPAEAPAAAADQPVQQVQPSSGAQLVQIGAFDSNSIAQSEWSRLSNKHGSLFSGRGQVIQQHQSNGRTFWRLRAAGFESRAQAQEFCAALKAGGTDCIPIAAQ